VPVTFLVKDALTLKDWTERFDTVIDSGLFHVFSDEDRLRYLKGLATVLKAGGRLFLMCFSDEEPGSQGPRRVSQQELHDAFAQGKALRCKRCYDQLKDWTKRVVLFVGKFLPRSVKNRESNRLDL
jgi:cyclopropane fatty-acyl-phospholipid synthase-like methyltransferase